jgi:hypothetical protein
MAAWMYKSHGIATELLWRQQLIIPIRFDCISTAFDNSLRD